MAKVVVTQPVQPEQLERLQAAGHDVVALEHPRGLEAAEVVEAVTGADGLLCQLSDEISAEVFAVPGLRVVANIAVGYDNVDVPAAQANDVVVTNTPDVLTDATADLAMALLLGAARNLPSSDAEVRAETHPSFGLLREPMGTDVTGATFGIVGLGRIGRAVARRAHFGFDMPILYTSRRPAEGLDFEATRLPLEELLPRADFVSLHPPLNAATRHLINREALALMRPTAILINTGRGGLVNEVDLADALQNGTIAGAGLDVLEHEPDAHPDLLACGSKVVLTPHIGSATTQTRMAMTGLAVDNLLAVLAGRPPLTPIT
jgi:glyoxylate reductase